MAGVVGVGPLNPVVHHEREAFLIKQERRALPTRKWSDSPIGVRHERRRRWSWSRCPVKQIRRKGHADGFDLGIWELL